jgi:hypothetical protein
MHFDGPKPAGGGPPLGPAPRPTDRRDALRKIGVGAAVAWTAPLVLSATARASATEAPPPDPCSLCGTNAIPNPDADQGTANWVDVGPSTTVVEQYDPGFPAPVGGASPNYFSVTMPDGFNNFVENEIAVPLACGGRNWTFSAYAANRTSTLVRVELCFCDVDHGALDDVVIAELTADPQMVLVQGAGTVPLGTAFIGVEIWVESPDSGDGVAAFDHVSLDLACA